MPKEKLSDSRYDFSGGLNTSDSIIEVAKFNEFNNLDNVRVVNSAFTSGPFAVDQAVSNKAIIKRRGSQRIHTTQIGVAGNRQVRGVFQWDAPAGLQTVAVAGGRFYHKITETGDFTEVIPGTPISDTRISWQPFRASTSGAPLVLYFAAGGQVWKWDGTTLTKIDGVSNVPAASILRSYGTRMFAAGVSTFKKHIFWSKIGNAEDFTTGGAADGGSAMVDVLTGDEISALEVFGSSLFVFTFDSVVRLTGVSNDDIQIDQDIAGIAGMLGPRHIDLAYVLDIGIAILTKRGLYIINESEIIYVSKKIEITLNSVLSNTVLDQAFLVVNNSQQEIWLCLPHIDDAFVYYYPEGIWRLVTWNVVDTMQSGNRWRGTTNFIGDRSIIGGEDGFVRLTDGQDFKDDMLSDGSGGTNFSWIFTPSRTYFVNPPGIEKAIYRVYVIASLEDGASISVTLLSQDAVSQQQVISQTGGDSIRKLFRLDFNFHTRRGAGLVIGNFNVGEQTTAIFGITVLAYNMYRE